MQHETIELLQRAALAHASRSTEAADAVFTICDVADFMPGKLQDIASLIVQQLNAEQPIDEMTMFTRCGEQSGDLSKFYGVEIHGQDYGSPGYVATKVREHAERERATVAVVRAHQALTSSAMPVGDILADLSQAIEIAESNANSGLAVVTFEEMMDTPLDIRPWVVPDMLRTNERMIITGPEGGGKSVLIAQMCLGAAMGVNTMSVGLEVHEPLRVLMLDVENDRLQVKQNMQKVYPILNEMSGGVKPLIEWVDVRDIDLSNSVERQRIMRLAKERQPQLLYMGSLYKLAPEGDRVDSAFGHVSRTVDRIRAETGTSILIEAHTGHGMQNDRNGAMRPYGSSMWLRWPEFGMAMIPQKGKHVQIKHWRGARSDDRVWPAGLKRSGVLPWTPISDEEWEVLYQ